MNADGYGNGAGASDATIGPQNRGFTLVEVIATLCIAAIAGALLLTLVGNATLEGPAPLGDIQRTLVLQEAMENITADIRHLIDNTTLPPAWAPGTAYASGDRVRALSRPFGHAYQCVSVSMPGGVSGGVEPGWVTTAGAFVTDGDITWKEDGGQFTPIMNRLVQLSPLDPDFASSPLADGKVHQYLYGRYALRQAGFIRFTADVETPVTPTDPDTLLKIVIAGETGEPLVGLFTATY